MKKKLFAILLSALIALALCVMATAQRFTNPPAGWTELPVQDGQAVLEKFLNGKKMVVVTAAVVGTLETVTSAATVCNEEGTVCSKLADHVWWMDLSYQASDNSMIVISGRCAPLWSRMGQNCLMPILGAQDGVVIERRKKGKYSVYIALRQGSLDKKGSVSKYEIVDLRHFTK